MILYRGAARVVSAIALSGLMLLAAVATNVSAAGAAVRSHTSQPTVYMIGQVTNSTFWNAVKTGFLDGGKTFGLHAIYEAPTTASAAEYNPMVSAALAKHPAGIAINYTSKAIEPAVLKALNDHVATVLYNSAIFKATRGKPTTATTTPRVTSLPYVGETIYKHAQALATAFTKYLKPHAKVLIVNPIPGLEVLSLRENGVVSILNKEGFAHATLAAGLSTVTNYATIGAYLTAHPTIGGIVGLGGPTGNPAAKYVQDKHLKIPVATFDITSATYKYLKANVIKVTTDQEPYLQGYLSAMDLMLEVKDHLNPVTVSISSYIVTSKTVGLLAYAIAHGLD